MTAASSLLLIGKITVLFVVTAAALWMMRRASASSRHLLITLVFGAALLLPLLALALPGWAVVVIDEPVAVSGESERPDKTFPDVGVALPQSRSAGPVAAVVERETRGGEGLAGFLSTLDPKRTAAWIWATVAISLLGLLVARAGALQRTIRRAVPIGDRVWTDLVEEFSRRLHIDRPVTLLRGATGQMPLVWGARKPVILLPRECDRWSDLRRRAVLAHELAHIARRDVAAIVLGQLVCALHWFHPLAWWLERRLAAERERACDDAALVQGVPASQYAEQLLQVARTYGRTRNLAPVMAARSELEGRIVAILDTDRNRHDTSWKIRGALLVLLPAALIPLSAATWAVQETKTETETEPRFEFDFRFVNDSDSARFREHLIQRGMLDADTETLIRGLRSTDALTRGACAWALGEKGDPSAVQPLIETSNDVDPTVREWSLRALGELRDPSALEPTVARLDDRDSNVREWAARVLGDLGDTRAVEPLIDSLRDPDGQVREWVARSLGDLADDRAVEPLIDALNDENSQVREWAARSLGEFRDDRAIQPLTDRLDDPDPQVQEWAARSLGDYGASRDMPEWRLRGGQEPLMPDMRRSADRRVGDPETIDALIRSLESDEPDVREWAARSLGAIGDLRAVDPLIRSLEDRDEQVREWSARALGVLRDERMVDPLIDRLDDRDDQVREWSVRALGAYGAPRSVEPLRAMLDDESAQVRRWAKRALENMGVY